MSEIKEISKIKTIINGEQQIFAIKMPEVEEYEAGQGIKIENNKISITLPWAEENYF